MGKPGLEQVRRLVKIMAELISVVVGGALALTGGLLTKLWEGQRERRALSSALAGEIAAVVEIVERRNYPRAVRELILAVEASHEPLYIQVPVTQKYFTVYEANAAKVGLLPRHAARGVACFYAYAKSIIEDVTSDKFPPRTEAEALHRLRQLDELLAKLLALGKELPKQLEE